MSTANAAFNGLTHHSRASCVNNETISWDATKSWELRTWSNHIHVKDGVIVENHTVVDDWRNTKRSAALHWGEGVGKWSVYGQHWMKDTQGRPFKKQEEIVFDCDIYDGWWEWNEEVVS